jgi:hypothetical protein
MMVLVRDSKTDKAILGHIVLDDTLICYTCENREKAIPVGLYSLQNSKSPKFKRELPLLYNATVPAKRGIRIHVGNTVASSSGCILVGMGRNYVKPNAEPSLLESTKAETMVTMLCRNVEKLVIVDATP